MNLQNISTLFAEMGHLLTIRGVLSEARVVLEGLEELEPDLAIVDILHGGLEVACSDFRAAEHCYRKALDKDSGSELAKVSLAESLLLQKRFREGERLLGEVIEGGSDESSLRLARELEQGLRRGDFQNL